jgi:hypothetical protein
MYFGTSKSRVPHKCAKYFPTKHWFHSTEYLVITCVVDRVPVHSFAVWMEHIDGKEILDEIKKIL